MIWKPAWIASWRAVVELACFLPFLVTVQEFLSDKSLLLPLLVFYCGYMTGYFAARLRMKVYMERLASLLLAFAASIVLFGISIGATVHFILLAFVIYRGMRLRNGNWDTVLPLSAQFVGLAAYLLFPIVANMIPVLKEQYYVIYLSGFFVLIVFFYRLNRIQIMRANLNNSTGDRVPAKVIRTNRYAVGAVLLLLILAANLDAIKRWLGDLWARFKEWLNDFLSRQPPQGEAEMPQSEPVPSFFDQLGKEPRERSEFWKTVEEIAVNILTVAIVTAFVAGVVYLFVKRGIPFIRNWMSSMNKRREEEADYTDETEKLAVPEWGRKLKNVLGRMTVRRTAEPAGDRERVRHLYKKMLSAAAKDGYQHHPSLTPAESERELERMGWRKQPVELLTRLYNRVRYREADVHEQDMLELRSKMKNV